MRLSVPLTFLAVVATLLFVNLGWWVHYYEPSDEALNVQSSGKSSRDNAPSAARGSPSQSRVARAPAAPVDNKPPRRVEVAAQTARQAAAAAKDAALKREKYKVDSGRQPVAAGNARSAAEVANSAAAAAASATSVKWDLHVGRSCQGYADNDPTSRSLSDSKAACALNQFCVAIECPTGRQIGCTLREVGNLVPYKPVDCYLPHDDSDPNESKDGKRKIALHPEYMDMLRQYPFQAVRTQTGKTVNIMLVRSAPNARQIEMIERLRENILFIGISSFEDFPKPSVNPFSPKHAPDKYTGMFDGFLHMLRPDDAAKWFPPHVKLLLMSQSDFSLPNHAFRDYSVPRKYDFTYSGSDQDVRNDCVGWSSFAKNWSFVKEALEVMCGEFHLKGVLVATIDKQNVKRCSIPKSCDGLITQTQYISQAEFHSYVEQSRFLFLPQIHDASPRVSTQALALDVPLLMNAYISGGWKYLNEKTGEFFHDLSDFRDALRKIITNADIEKHYEPRKWVTERYGNAKSCKRLYEWIATEFPDWAEAVLPKGTNCLLI